MPISPGTHLVYTVQPGDTLYRIAERYSAGVDMLAALNRMERPNILPVARLVWVPAFVYEVEQDDSLFRISRRFGVPMSELTRANRGRPGFSPDVIYPGFRLVIPLPSSTNTVVFQPLPGSKIASGSPLSGAARAFEAVVHRQIRDASGRVVTADKAVTAAEGAPAFGRFETTISLDRSPATPTGTLMVYTRSARNGSIQDLVEVPVSF